MQKRRFGKTNLLIPPITVGFMRSMQSWQDISEKQIDHKRQDSLESVVYGALDRGLNHFETAHGYGSSERQLGLVLAKIPRDRFILQTKVIPRANAEEFTREIGESLSRLKLQYVDLLALHGINDHQSLHYACRPNGCFEAARRLQKQGKIGKIGFSGHGSTEIILEAVRYEEHGGFDYLNIHWYYIFQRNWDAILEAHKRDMGVMIISPSDKGGKLYDPPSELVKMSAPLSPMAFNDVFCLSKPQVSAISVGAIKPEDFDEHIAALQYINNDKIISEIDQRLQQAMEQYTGYKRPDALWDCLPSWKSTPGYINMPFIIWLYNLARAWGLNEYSKGRYALLGNQMPWVRGRNAERLNDYDFNKVLNKTKFSVKDICQMLEEAHEFLGDNS